MRKLIKDYLLGMLDLLEMGDILDVYPNNRYAPETLKEILKNNFNWRKPDYGKYSKDDLLGLAQDFNDEYIFTPTDELKEAVRKRKLPEEITTRALEYLHHNTDHPITNDAKEKYLDFVILVLDNLFFEKFLGQ